VRFGGWGAFERIGLFVRYETLYLCDVGHIGSGDLAEVPLSLGALLGEYVRLIGVRAQHLAVLGYFETLFCTRMGLDLRHGFSSF